MASYPAQGTNPWDQALLSYLTTNYLLLSGGTLTGQLTVNSGGILLSGSDVHLVINNGRTPTRPVGSIFGVNVGADQNFWLRSNSNTLNINATNDAYNANVALNISASTTTFDAGGIEISGGNVGIGTSPTTGYGLLMQGNSIAADGASSGAGITVNPTFGSGVTNVATGIQGILTTAASITVTETRSLQANNPNKGSGATITTAKGLNIDGITAGGTNNYGAFINTPSGASGNNTHLVLGAASTTGNQYIDTNAGSGTPAHLTTSGSWTNASSWREGKTSLKEVTVDQVQNWLSLLAKMPQPQFYRYPHTSLQGGHLPQHYNSMFHLLDDIPQEIREVICDDAGGGISTKDTDGFLLACIQEHERAIQRLLQNTKAKGVK